MIGALVVTHGSLGRELVAAAEMIVGEISHIRAVSIGWHDDVNDAHNDIEKHIAEVEDGEGVLILTDMFGGTPSNISLSFLDEHQVEVVTGLNLPMLIKLATMPEPDSLPELATFIKQYGQRNISVASELLPEEGK